MFLDLKIPDDDPLRPAKLFINTAAPGFRVFEKDDSVQWESDFIWLSVVNEEDGLDLKIRQTIDGKREVQAFWKDRELDDTSRLRDHLEEDPAWDVFQLRSTVLLQNRVGLQMEVIQAAPGLERQASVRVGPWKLAEKLRNLELEMLKRTAAVFESQVRFLLYPALYFFQVRCDARSFLDATPVTLVTTDRLVHLGWTWTWIYESFKSLPHGWDAGLGLRLAGYEPFTMY